MKKLAKLLFAFFILCGSTFLSASHSTSKVIYSGNEEIYLTNRFGEMPVKVLKKLPRGVIDGEKAFDSYFHASLSPDEKFIVAIRIKNHKVRNDDREHETYEALIYSLENGQEHVFYQLPPTSKKAIASPIWSKDGKHIYFLMKDASENALYSYDIAAGKSAEVHKFPCNDYIIPTHENKYYIKLSKDGARIFSLLSGSIWETNIQTGQFNKLWNGTINETYNKVNRIPEGLSEEAITSLFGSKEFPFLNPRLSSDGTFYYYFTYREGFFARYWIGGHSLDNNENFIIKTIKWALYTE